jgi:hypothetical protein
MTKSAQQLRGGTSNRAQSAAESYERSVYPRLARILQESHNLSAMS